MIHRRSTLAPFAFAFALASCAARPAAGPASHVTHTAHDYFPLASGAGWSFDAREEGTNGLPALVTMHVAQAQEDRWFVEQGRGAPALYEVTDGALVRNGEPILRGPFEPGTHWRGRAGDDYAIVQTGLTRTVPAGTFRDVIEVRRTADAPGLAPGSEYRETYFYAPGAGPIEAVVPILAEHGLVRRFHLVLRGYTLTGTP